MYIQYSFDTQRHYEMNTEIKITNSSHSYIFLIVRTNIVLEIFKYVIHN